MLETIATLVNHNGKSFIKVTLITTCGLPLIANKDQVSTKIILDPNANKVLMLLTLRVMHRRALDLRLPKELLTLHCISLGENCLNGVYHQPLLQIP